MREIKFRAWDTQENKMLSFEDLNNQTFNVLKSIYHGVSNWKFMQYTGLKDKNGNGIYEGDILRINKRNIKTDFIVRWQGDGFMCIEEKNVFGYSLQNITNIVGGCEIIGNIYENSYLLSTQPSQDLTPPQAENVEIL